MHNPRFIFPCSIAGPELAVPAGKALAIERPTAVLVPGQPAVWRFELPAEATAGLSAGYCAYLRLVPALDVRVYQSVILHSAVSCRFLTRRFVGLPSPFEILDLPLPDDALALIADEGLAITLEGEGPLFVFGESGLPPADGIPAAALASSIVLQPVEQTLAERQALLRDRLCSVGAWMPWDWLGGCVLDGLHALATVSQGQERADYQAAIERYLDQFLTPTGVRYVSHVATPIEDRVDNVETGLPWATLARYRPAHPANDLVPAFHEQHARDTSHWTCEGNYTYTYPLMINALRLRSDDLVAAAFDNLRTWRDQLHQGDQIWLRNYGGALTYRNWARGCCWYMMGLARCLEAAAHAGRALPPDLVAELSDCIELMLSRQRADGLWSNFTTEAGQLPDTSGSSGITAAMLLASRHGWLPPALSARCEAAAARALATLWHYVTADGHLTGVAPNNKKEGGTALQRQERRCTLNFGLGLFASALAASRLPVAESDG